MRARPTGPWAERALPQVADEGTRQRQDTDMRNMGITRCKGGDCSAKDKGRDRRRPDSVKRDDSGGGGGCGDGARGRGRGWVYGTRLTESMESSRVESSRIGFVEGCATGGLVVEHSY